mgnify:CR=1 FL=1
MQILNTGQEVYESIIILSTKAYAKGMYMTTVRATYLAMFLVVSSLMVTSVHPSAQSSGHLLDVVELLSNGETVFGSIVNVESGFSGAITMSRSDADYVFFDMEHGPLDNRIGQVRREAATAGYHDLGALNYALLVKTDVVGVEEVVALAGLHHVVGSGEPVFHRFAGGVGQ